MCKSNVTIDAVPVICALFGERIHDASFRGNRMEIRPDHLGFYFFRSLFVSSVKSAKFIPCILGIGPL